jgi:hypothetical protein
LTFPFRRFFSKDMAQVGLGAFDTAFTGAGESLRRPTVGFHLRHF